MPHGLPPANLVALVGGMPSVERVRELEALMLTLPQVPIETQTLTHGRVSARAVLIPAGSVLTGALTNLDNVCIILGDITVTTDAGPRRITGFGMLPANRGAKRVGEAHADTWWITVHHTDLTDQHAIEDEMTNESASLQSRLMQAGALLDAQTVPADGRVFWNRHELIGGAA